MGYERTNTQWRLDMTVCRFVGFTADDPSLYGGINYDTLARDLYDATLGQWGTDEKKVYEVFAKAIGVPLARLMPRTVSVFRCTKAMGTSCFSATESNETFLTEGTRGDCGWQDVGPEDYREDRTGDFESDIARQAAYRLERSLIAILSPQEALAALDGITTLNASHHPHHPFLEWLILDEMNEDHWEWLSTFGGIIYTGRARSELPGAQPTDATREECKDWVLGKYRSDAYPSLREESAASAVCSFLPEPVVPQGWIDDTIY